MGERVRLVHWNQAEADGRAARLRDLGYEVDGGPVDPGSLKNLTRDPPAAVVIDLSRLPMQGRDVAVAVRMSRRGRHAPLVFVGGEPSKAARVKETLPDAVYTTWDRIAHSLPRAISAPPSDPQIPDSRLSGYSGTPLPRKLGIVPGSVVALLGAPDGFEDLLGPLPTGVTLRRSGRGRADLTLWFTRSRRELLAGVGNKAARLGRGGLWIAWPKKASGIETGLTQPVVRAAGLAAGLVDHKICAIDTTWSALRFSQRRRP